MKLILLVGSALAIIAVGLAGTHIERAVYDPAPAPEEVAGTITVDIPVPDLEPREPQPDQPLPKELVVKRATEASVGAGTIRVPAGLRVELTEDRGEYVQVRLGKDELMIPRSAIVARASDAPSLPVAALQKASMQVDKILYSPPTNLGIDVKEIGTGKGIDRTWTTSYGSYERDYYRTKGLNVSVRNVSRRETGDCEVQIYWVGRHVGTRELHIHHAEKLPMQLGPISSGEAVFWSPLLAANDTVYVALRRRTVAGSKIDGWLVVVSRNGRTLAGRGSGPTYEEMLRKPKNLETLLASYTPTGRPATAHMPQWRTDPLRSQWREALHSDATVANK